ncbi:MAG TPA: hypothetical protein VJM12_00250 [Pyrinomonadaceae bacterium]|nr:hypothetical protein [Pyrinomonadaceae bacterium]
MARGAKVINKRFTAMVHNLIRLSLLIASILLGPILFGCGLVQAQETRKEIKTSPEAKVRDEQRQQQILRILAILRATSDGAKDWDDAAAASKTQAQIADLMWDFDAEAGRSYLIKAWDTASRIEYAKTQSSSRYRNTSLRTMTGREVILVARRRAPDLAQKWLDQIANYVESDRGKEARGIFDDRTARSAVLLQMSLQILNDDPQAAAGMAIESLSDGISFGFQEVLVRLHEKDFELAQRVFLSALARLRTVGMSDPNELLILNAYLYTPGRTMAANTGDDPSRIEFAVGRNRPRIVPAAQLNPALATEFLNLAADLLLTAQLPSTTSNPPITARAQITTMSSLLDRIAQISPDKGAMLAQRLQMLTAEAKFSSTRAELPEGHIESKPGESAPEYNERRVDYLEKLAEKETTTLSRDVAYAKAALATTVTAYQRGWEIATKIDDDRLRANVRNCLMYRATLHFLSRNDTDKAYELIGKNTDALQRAASLVVGAQRLLTAKDALRASEWLNEARVLIKRTDPEEGAARVAFGIVSTYGKFDRLMAFDALSEAVRLLNKTKLTSLDQDRVPLFRRFSGFEIADFSYGTEGFSLKAAIDVFGPKEFDDVLTSITKITATDLRGVAVLELCRKYLLAKPARTI